MATKLHTFAYVTLSTYIKEDYKMAITVDYKKKVGEAVLLNVPENRIFELSLYQGNCFLVFINEGENEQGEMEHYLYSFFADIPHAKNCLGLTKGNTNIYNDEYIRLMKVSINPDMYSYTDELMKLLAKAFDNITIEICRR